MAERMIMIWLMKAWQGLLKLLELALKHWRITVAVIICVAVYAHAVFAHKRVTALENQIIGYQATIDQYERTEAVLRKAVDEQTMVAKQKVTETEKQKVIIDERIKYIYKTDPVSAEWSVVPVPDAVADQLRNY
jgi:hypothetical protein